MVATRTRRLGAALLSLALVTSASAATTPRPKQAPPLDPARTVIIEGAIGGNIGALAAPLMEMSEKDIATPVNIVISSPGGNLLPGYLFVNVIESIRGRGTPVHCYVPTIAASMAFQILLHCDKRVALDNALLLWHGARVVTGEEPVTEQVAENLAAQLHKVNTKILSEVVAVLSKSMSEKDILFHFMEETLHTGKDLAELAPSFIESATYIPGLIEILTNPTVARSSRQFLKLEVGSIVYIAPSGITKDRQAPPAPAHTEKKGK